jgi:hypothetical protein
MELLIHINLRLNHFFLIIKNSFKPYLSGNLTSILTSYLDLIVLQFIYSLESVKSTLINSLN